MPERRGMADFSGRGCIVVPMLHLRARGFAPLTSTATKLLFRSPGQQFTMREQMLRWQRGRSPAIRLYHRMHNQRAHSSRKDFCQASSSGEIR
jgi:hypothetical protein